MLARLERVRRTPRGWVALCPAHGDRNPSLSVATGDDGKVLLYCFAGCTVADIVSAIGIEMSQLFPPTDTWRPSRPRNTLHLVRMSDIIP